MGIAANNPYGASGGGAWSWLPPERIADIVIAEDDPEHPEHQGHKDRTSLDNPEFAQLLADIRRMRMIGMKEAKPIIVWLDGKTPTLAEGRRTICALRIVNAESKPADRLSVKMTITKDPELARDIGNANRASDPLMILAQRYAAAHAVDGDKGAAAARVGLPLSLANVLEKCMALPAELKRKINLREIDPEQALRLAKDGGAAAAKKVRAATKKSGKVDGAALDRAAAPRLSTRLLRGIAKQVQELPLPPTKDAMAAQIAAIKSLFVFMQGDRTAADAEPETRALLLRAGWNPKDAASEEVEP